jgi:hypothetical protein
MTPPLPHHVVLVSLTALPAWLALTREERGRVVAEEVEPAAAAHPACTLRWIDAEAFTATCSDVLLVETEDLRAWTHLWERLRDSSLFAVPYFALEGIVLGVEDGYVDYERELATAGASRA